MTPFGTAALVTGTDSSGMGRAIALHLADVGMDVAVHCYRSRDRAEITDPDWDRVHAFNLRGTFCVAQEPARCPISRASRRSM